MGALEDDSYLGKERRRNFEILKYGHTARIDHGSSGPPVAPAAQNPRLADDAILTAFCKLLTLQLQCLHALVCLSDSSRQHIIAEATQTVSPYDGSIHAPHDGILFGLQSLDNKFSLTSVTLPLYTGRIDQPISNPYTSITSERSIFLDLHHEPLVKDTPFVAINRQYRFYLEAPLKNASGIVVGVVAALDTRPRSNFSMTDARPILDAARMIMEHLELLRLRDSQARAEKLMQGLGRFNVGQSGLVSRMAEYRSQALSKIKVGDDLDQATANTAFDRFHLNELQSPTESTFSPLSPSTQPEQLTSTASTAPLMDLESIRASVVDDAVGPITSSTSESIAHDTVPSTTSLFPDDPEGLPAGSRKTPDQILVDIERTLTRAAFLIRDAMDLEATSFFRISPNLHTNLHSPAPLSPKSYSKSESPTRRSDADNGEASAVASSESDGRDDPETSLHLCKRIATSVEQVLGSSGSGVSRDQEHLPGKLARLLTSLYPRGHLFQFDASGIISSGDDSEQGPKPVALQSRRNKVGQMLQTSFPGARSLMYMPLYDNERQQLLYAFFGWVNESNRALNDDDLIYIAGFANSVMCEIMRLETCALEKAKTVFMSSISHELRSPLHGILAATELLRESNLDNDQEDFALMINSCGQTLLDIINSLLEHANINNRVDKKITRSRRKKLRQRIARPNTGEGSSHSPAINLVDLAEATEATIVSVVAGHAIKHQRAKQVSSRAKNPSEAMQDTDSADFSDTRAPGVIIEIEKHDSWSFRLDAGTWRRIVMNLVGNALKYTATGHIAISLQLTQLTRRFRQCSHHVTLKVSDSGQGISEKYMRNKLYTPFAQEDQLSVGVGLGLSIVKRLVAELGGKIHITSEIDVGTEVSLSIPLPPPEVPRLAVGVHTASHTTVLQQPIADQATVYFCGFDVLPALDTAPTGTMSAHALSLLKLKQSLATMVEKWFPMATTPTLEGSSICFLDAHHGQELLKQNPKHELFKKRYIIVESYDQRKAYSIAWPGIHTMVTMPVGPVKLARALTILLRKDSDKDGVMPERMVSPADTSALDEIPRQGRANHEPESVHTPSDNQPLGVDRVLLVDDNMINLRILAALVRKLELEFMLAENGQEALDLYIAAHQQHQPFTYVFMDVSMPVMDGLTCTRHIRAYERNSSIPIRAQIFALTGLGHIDTQDKAFANGIDEYFRKPIRLDVLRKLLTRDNTEQDRPQAHHAVN